MGERDASDASDARWMLEMLLFCTVRYCMYRRDSASIFEPAPGQASGTARGMARNS